MTIAGHATVTATGAVKTSGGALVSVLLTAGSDLATIVLHDNAAAASGVELCTIKAAANTSVVWTPTNPYVFSNGIYATVTGTSPTAAVVHA